MKEKKNIENFDREILARYFNNEVNSREKLEVETWIAQSEQNQKEAEEIKEVLDRVDTFYETKQFNSSVAWNHVKAQINATQPTKLLRANTRKEAILRFYKYAAIVVVALLLAFMGYYMGQNNLSRPVYREIIAAENQVLNEYKLPDGTLVTLNSNSQLSFPKTFKNNVREVSIVGEAFFDVTPNPEKPFIINTEKAQVKVLGTSFTVSAYPESEKLEVAVKTGKVQVNPKQEGEVDHSQTVFLLPGQKGSMANKSNTIEKSDNTDINYFAWKTHDLVFDKTPLKEVVLYLEKVYHIDIQLADSDMESLALTARFNQKPVGFVLDVIRLTFNLQLTENDKQFIFSRAEA